MRSLRSFTKPLFFLLLLCIVLLKTLQGVTATACDWLMDPSQMSLGLGLQFCGVPATTLEIVFKDSLLRHVLKQFFFITSYHSEPLSVNLYNFHLFDLGSCSLTLGSLSPSDTRVSDTQTPWLRSISAGYTYPLSYMCNLCSILHDAELCIIPPDYWCRY